MLCAVRYVIVMCLMHRRRMFLVDMRVAVVVIVVEVE